MKEYFKYLYWVNPGTEGSKEQRFTPSYMLGRQAPMLASVCLLTEELIPEGKYVPFMSGLPVDWKYGLLTADDATLSAIGWDAESVKNEMVELGKYVRIKFVTKDEFASEIRSFTSCREVEPGLFVSDEGSGGVGATYIDCR